MAKLLSWQIHKFGGTSLADAARIEHAAQLIGRVAADGDERRGVAADGDVGTDDGAHIAVVVSAMAGVTDTLIDAASAAARNEPGYTDILQQLRERTAETCRALLKEPEPAIGRHDQQIGELEDVLRGVHIAGVCPPSTLDLVSGFGELWSAQILHRRLVQDGLPAAHLDARDVLVVERDATGPAVVWDTTEEKFHTWLAANTSRFVVITGFVARDREGTATTLQRNGSDFTASIFGRLFDADSITIWTDVDGVMSAHPAKVPEATVIDELSYSEAIELAFFGTEVLHPQTMGPAVDRGIPIYIRNASRPEATGTWIRAGSSRHAEAGATTAVKGLSSIGGIALLSLEGAGMIGVPGIASRLFAALRDVGISVIMISQASSEHSICVAIPLDQQDAAKQAVENAFPIELAHGQIQRIAVSGPYSILAAVGDDMVEMPGVSARFFGTLARAGVSVRAIAQGSSERNISAVVAEADAPRALRATHAGFYLAERSVSVGLIGPGLVGAELLAQLHAQSDILHADLHIDLRVRGIARSRTMVLDDAGFDLAHWQRRLDADGRPVDLVEFADHVRAPHLPHAVILDCSASEDVAVNYEAWLERGIHVVTPNKQANTGSLHTYRRLRRLGDRLATRYLYEATVGAGLPVVSTLRDLIRTGDRVRKIEGILSGTLSFLLGTFGADTPFSSVVKEARDRGYMEPDPRDDLSGVDVARKAVILGREIGLDLSLDQVPVSSLVPDELADCADPDHFFAKLPKFDAEMESQRLVAVDAGAALRYGALIEDSGAVSVGLRHYPEAHPFARIQPGDNILAFTTDRYRAQPLIVQGPGAGPAVTAAGVFGDLLRLVTSLGAPS